MHPDGHYLGYVKYHPDPNGDRRLFGRTYRQNSVVSKSFCIPRRFGFGFAEIASAVGRSEAARFFDAIRDGDVDGLRELLAADVQLVGDAGSEAPALAKGVIGADSVARVLALNIPALAEIDARLEPREVDGGHVGPVADAWAISRAVNRARRPTD